jgi:hypothetical protein
MAKSSDVLKMLCEGVEYVAIGENYEDIHWCGNAAPITKKQYQDGFANYDAWKLQQENAKLAAKQSAMDKLTALGLTADEVAALLP